MRKKSREMGADWALEVVLANNEFWDGAANRLYYVRLIFFLKSIKIFGEMIFCL